MSDLQSMTRDEHYAEIERLYSELKTIRGVAPLQVTAAKLQLDSSLLVEKALQLPR